MPTWLAQWSTFVIALILSIVFGGIVLGIFVPRIRNALFYRAVGSLVEAATRKTSERDKLAREQEHESSLRQERQNRGSDAMDKLTENLNKSVTVFNSGYNATGASIYFGEIHRAISQLQRDGPAEMQDQLAVIGTQLANGDPFTRTWVNTQVTVLNSMIRQWQSKS
jgi:hypothetical protein